MDDNRTPDKLRQRIADYRRLRSMVTDKQALEVIDGLIGEAEERLQQLDSRPRTSTSGSRLQSATYRAYFRSAGSIVGQHDFVAQDDAEAISMAGILCDACSDRCDSFDVWADSRMIATTSAPRRPPSADEIIARRQQAIIDHEDTIQRSRWAIASSDRLLERLAELRTVGPVTRSE